MIQQAQVTIQQLRKLASTLAEANLEQLIMSGQFMEYITLPEKFRLRDKIVKSLQEIGVPPDDILKAQSFWIIALCDGFLKDIERVAKKLRPSVDVEHEIDALPKDDKRGLPQPQSLRNWVSSEGLNDTEIKGLLDEYQNVWNTGRMINPSAKFP